MIPTIYIYTYIYIYIYIYIYTYIYTHQNRFHEWFTHHVTTSPRMEHPTMPVPAMDGEAKAGDPTLFRSKNHGKKMDKHRNLTGNTLGKCWEADENPILWYLWSNNAWMGWKIWEVHKEQLANWRIIELNDGLASHSSPMIYGSSLSHPM